MLHVNLVHLLPVHVADDKQRADDSLSHSGQDGLHQSSKIDEGLSCDKGEWTDVLVTIDDVINNEDTGLHVPEDPLMVPCLPTMVFLSIQWFLLHMMKCVLLNQNLFMEMHLAML